MAIHVSALVSLRKNDKAWNGTYPVPLIYPLLLFYYFVLDLVLFFFLFLFLLGMSVFLVPA